MDKCSNCFYEQKGKCHRYPPAGDTYTDNDNEIVTYFTFPDVSIDSWCGEFKLKCCTIEDCRHHCKDVYELSNCENTAACKTSYLIKNNFGTKKCKFKKTG